MTQKTAIENYLLDGIIREKDKSKWVWETFMPIDKITTEDMNKLLKYLAITSKTKSKELDKHNKTISGKITPYGFFTQMVFDQVKDEKGYMNRRKAPSIGQEYKYDIMIELFEANKDKHDKKGIKQLVSKYLIEKPVEKYNPNPKSIRQKKNTKKITSSTTSTLDKTEKEIKSTSAPTITETKSETSAPTSQNQENEKPKRKRFANQRYISIKDEYFDKIEELADLGNTTNSKVIESLFKWSLDTFYKNKKEAYLKADSSLPKLGDK